VKRTRGLGAILTALVLVLAVSGCGSPAPPSAARSVPSGATNSAGVPLRLFVEPADSYRSVRALIGGARRTVDLTMYEFDDRRIEDALAAAHRRGVRVRVLLDRAFRGAAVNRAAFDRLTAAGVAVRWAPERLIVHQKTLTVDGDVSVVMTGNLTVPDEPSTRDFVVVDRNPAALSAIDGVFDAD
jgi:cardiolipin synthase A/B